MEVDDGGDPSVLEFEITGLPTGEFEVALSLAPAEIFAESIAARRLAQRVPVRAGETSEVVFESEAPTQGASLVGALLMPPGFERGWTTIELAPPGDGPLPEPVATTHPDTSGGFALRGLLPGDFVLRVQSITEEGLGSWSFPVRVAEGETRLPPLDLARLDVRLHGRADADLWVTSDDGFGLKVTIDASGIGHAWGLPPGRYTVREGSQQLAHFDVTADTTLLTVEVP
jgi:hypothetical protein